MNIAFLLTPKASVSCLYDDCTVRQGLEKMKAHGYTSIPVITRDNKYAGAVSEGDFLWYLVRQYGDTPLNIGDTDGDLVKDILQPDRNPPAKITESADVLIRRAVNQNFVPVVDDLGNFIGIVTRKDIIKYLYKERERTTAPAQAAWSAL
jgi:CBS domain-containing protein